MPIRKKVKGIPFRKDSNNVARLKWTMEFASIKGILRDPLIIHHSGDVIATHSDNKSAITNFAAVDGGYATHLAAGTSTPDGFPDMTQVNNTTVREEDEDSAYGEELTDTTAALCDSAEKFEKKYGREYVTHYQDGSFPYPNDPYEQGRLDMFHHHVTNYLADGESGRGRRLFFAPIKPCGKNILDIGTGTGIWAIEMGDKYPKASIFGSDLSPIQPELVPQNVQFILDDLDRDWYDHLQYHFIHCRNLGGSIKDWPNLISEIYQHLEAGGWVEFHELSTKFTSEDGKSHGPSELIKDLDEACSNTGRILDPTPSIKDWLVEAGFDHVRQETFKFPIGDWPTDSKEKQIGTAMREYIFHGLHGMTERPLRETLGRSKKEAEMCRMTARATMSQGARLSVDYVMTMAQKI